MQKGPQHAPAASSYSEKQGRGFIGVRVLGLKGLGFIVFGV